MEPKSIVRPNVQQVAERAGVSRMTVSRVLQNRRDQVSPETYERVVVALRELDYVPVKMAFQSHHNQTHVVGLVPHSTYLPRHQIDLQTVGAVCHRGAQCGYDVMIAQRGESEWMAGREEIRFLDRRTDGFIFISPGAHEWNSVFEALVRHSVPVVACYRRDVPEGVAWVDPDNRDMMNQAFDCLLRAGHTHIAYLAPPAKTSDNPMLLADRSGTRSNFDHTQRYATFVRRMKELGHEDPESAVFRARTGFMSLEEDQVDALLQSGATAAIGFCGELGVRLHASLLARGIGVPEDFSIVNLDWWIESGVRNLTHVTFDMEEMGRCAMDAWIELTQGKPAHECCKEVPVQLVERASVGPPHRRD